MAGGGGGGDPAVPLPPGLKRHCTPVMTHSLNSLAYVASPQLRFGQKRYVSERELHFAQSISRENKT